MKFSDALASSIHDIKNALGIVVNTVEELSAEESCISEKDPRVSRLFMEAQRANTDLVQLLMLYKMETEKFAPNIAEHNIDEFLSDLIIENTSLSQAKGIELGYQVDEYLSGYFDAQLVRSVLNSAIGNARRYTKNKILLSADKIDDFLVLRVEDNGHGFPSAMLKQQAVVMDDQDDKSQSQLGLVFAKMVARAHKNRTKMGLIKLQNHCNLAGGCFALYLP